jgi:hypothetical protein
MTEELAFGKVVAMQQVEVVNLVVAERFVVDTLRMETERR